MGSHETKPATLGGGEGRYVLAAKTDRPRIGRERAGKDAEKRRLAGAVGAVGADDADGFLLPHLEIEAIEHDERAVALAHAERAQRESCGGPMHGETFRPESQAL